MNRIISTLIGIPNYFDKYWWSFIQDSQYYFCDKKGNIILPENLFAYNPIIHFFMSLKYELKYWDECDSENSIFVGKNYNLKEINRRCRKYHINTMWVVQVYVDGNYVQHFDLSAKPKQKYKTVQLGIDYTNYKEE